MGGWGGAHNVCCHALPPPPPPSTRCPPPLAQRGLRTYEQDWLYNELQGVSLLTQNITAARTWLLQMNAGAEEAGTTIQ